MVRAIVGAVLGCACVLFGWRVFPGPLGRFLESHLLFLIAWLSILGAVLGGAGAVLARIEDLGHFARRRLDAIEGSKPSAKPEKADDEPD